MDDNKQTKGGLIMEINKEIAKRLMKEVQYEAGAVNRYEKENYPEEWVEKIAERVSPFMDNLVRELAYGSSERLSFIGGTEELMGVLDEYFNSI